MPETLLEDPVGRLRYRRTQPAPMPENPGCATGRASPRYARSRRAAGLAK